MSPIQAVGLWAIVIFWLGLVTGAAVAYLALREGLAMGGQMVRSGRPRAPASAAAVVPGGANAPRAHGLSVEGQAAERALKNVLERGADELQDLEPGLTRKEALAKARRILEETGAFNLSGGIPSP